MATPTPSAVLDFLGWDQSAPALALAAAHVPVVTAYVHAYTRGEGFDSEGGLQYADDALGNVILTATARLIVNPHQNRREEIGDYSVVPPTFDGFTLIEQAVLHQYRRRSA